MEKARRGSKHRRAICPFCGKSDTFSIDVRSGSFKCFHGDCERAGHGLGGFAVLMAHVEGITEEQARATIFRQTAQLRRQDNPLTLLERVAAMRNHEVEADPDAAPDVGPPEEFVPVFHDGKWSVPTYLTRRGIKRETARAWGMGYATHGRYVDRIIMPMTCPNGRSLTARTVHKDVQPRYLNPPGVDHGKLLFGWHMVKPDSDLVLVEGPLDAVALWQHGIPAVAMLGNTLKDHQIPLLMRRPADAAIYVMLDPTETVKFYDVARPLQVRFKSIFLARLKGQGPVGDDGKPEKLDPGCCTKEQANEAIRHAERFDGARTGALAALLDLSRNRVAKNYQ